jgi:PAS domain-containing protein
MEEMTGCPAIEMLGKGDYVYAIPFYGERQAMLIDYVFKATPEIESNYTSFSNEGGIYTTEGYVPDLKGKRAFLVSTASALRDGQGNAVGAIQIIRDQTERKRLEEAPAPRARSWRR